MSPLLFRCKECMERQLVPASMRGTPSSPCGHRGTAAWLWLANKPCPSSLGQVPRALKNILIPKGLSVGRENLLERRELPSAPPLCPQAMVSQTL